MTSLGEGSCVGESGDSLHTLISPEVDLLLVTLEVLEYCAFWEIGRQIMNCTETPIIPCMIGCSVPEDILYNIIYRK